MSFFHIARKNKTVLQNSKICQTDKGLIQI